jgi:hypothetical protein
MGNEIHIRSNTTGRYLEPDGSWSALRADARHFSTSAEAKIWCVQECLVNVEIVVVRDALICMRVPVSENV